MKRPLFFFLLIGSIWQTAYAQSSLQLVVRDAATQQALPFANLYLKANQVGSSTDLQGRASLKLPKRFKRRDTLLCSFVGYRDTILVLSDLQKTTQVEIALQSEDQLLDEVLVRATDKEYTGLELVKKAIKSVKKNYPRKPLKMEAFYRETIQEGGNYIQLNEAAADFYYTGYPQKRFTRRAWRLYWKDAYYGAYAPSGMPIFKNPQFFKSYNTVKDQCKILGGRVSDNLSTEGVEPTAWGGPMGLTTLDKVKYRADFLDPKLLDDYTYQKQGAVYVDGVLCYVVRFAPYKLHRKVWQPWSKKIKFPLFAGRLYITVDDFAVVKFDCQFAKTARTEIYQDSYFPVYNGIRVAYQKQQGKWVLRKVETEQLMNKGKFHWIKKDYLCKRELFINTINLANARPHSNQDLSLLKDQHHSCLRAFPDSYDSTFWQTYSQSTSYVDLPDQLPEDMEENQPLAVQFKEQFTQQDLDQPQASIRPDSLLINGQKTRDDFRWMENSSTPMTKALIEEERNYFRNFMIPHRRDFNFAYQGFVNGVKGCEPEKERPLEVFEIGLSDADEFGTILLRQGKRILLIDHGKDLPPNTYLVDFEVNKDTTMVAFKWLEKQSGKRFLGIKKTGAKERLVTIPNVDFFHWPTRQELIYTTMDSLHRTDAIYAYACEQQQSRLLAETAVASDEIDVLEVEKGLGMSFENGDGQNETAYGIDFGGDSLFAQVLHPKAWNSFSIVRQDQAYWYFLASPDKGPSRLYQQRKKAKDESEPELLIESEKKEWLDDCLVTQDYVLAKVLDAGILKLYAYPRKTNTRQKIDLPEKHHAIYFEKTDYEKNIAHIQYSTHHIPLRTYELNLMDGTKKATDVRCKRDSVTYKTKLYQVKGRDGERIPLRVSQRKHGSKTSAHRGTILSVYGAYGAFRSEGFSEVERMYLNHGYTLAKAQVRGSRAKGWAWYEAGKLLQKKNSVTDFLDCAAFLIDKGITDTANLVGYGQSAGGLVLAAAVNQQPELFKVAVFDYPYLDVLTTMADDNLPLTRTEYSEWGNPHEQAYYDYIKSYSPYQNIQKQAYPNMLFLMGTKDFSTPYWQVLKSVAAYRRSNTGESEILSLINENGHPGTFAFKQRMRDFTIQYLFAQKYLNRLEVAKKKK